ncbi:MAG TPA: hypothetical protein DCE43_25250 [Planctomycetaceae bacterium]|nr:hypothetical protein [Planctomycetaceae bacterium]
MDHRHANGPLKIHLNPAVLPNLHVILELTPPFRIFRDVRHPVGPPVGVPGHAGNRFHQFIGFRIVRRHWRPHRINVRREATARVNLDVETVNRPTRIIRFFGDQR